MKSFSMAKKFYLCSNNYYDTCKLLKKKFWEDVNFSLLNPMVYLLRHTLELVLKALILLSIEQQELENNLNIDIYGEKFDLSRTHSLEVLINKFVYIQENHRLTTIYDEEMKNVIKIVIKYDKYDRGSDYYRYPLTKKGKFTIQKSGIIDDDMIEIGKKNQCFVFNFNQNETTIKHVTLYDKRTFEYSKKLMYSVDYLYSLLSTMFNR